MTLTYTFIIHIYTLTPARHTVAKIWSHTTYKIRETGTRLHTIKCISAKKKWTKIILRNHLFLFSMQRGMRCESAGKEERGGNVTHTAAAVTKLMSNEEQEQWALNR